MVRVLGSKRPHPIADRLKPRENDVNGRRCPLKTVFIAPEFHSLHVLLNMHYLWILFNFLINVKHILGSRLWKGGWHLPWPRGL